MNHTPGPMPKITAEVKRLLIIAFSAGYESGHHDTVEGVFCGNGIESEHDEMADEKIIDMLLDNTFTRKVEL